MTIKNILKKLSTLFGHFSKSYDTKMTSTAKAKILTQRPILTDRFLLMDEERNNPYIIANYDRALAIIKNQNANVENATMWCYRSGDWYILKVNLNFHIDEFACDDCNPSGYNSAIYVVDMSHEHVIQSGDFEYLTNVFETLKAKKVHTYDYLYPITLIMKAACNSAWPIIEPSMNDHYPEEVNYPKYEIYKDSLIYTWYEFSGGMAYSIEKHTITWDGKTATHQQIEIDMSTPQRTWGKPARQTPLSASQLPNHPILTDHFLIKSDEKNNPEIVAKYARALALIKRMNNHISAPSMFCYRSGDWYILYVDLFPPESNIDLTDIDIPDETRAVYVVDMSNEHVVQIGDFEAITPIFETLKTLKMHKAFVVDTTFLHYITIILKATCTSDWLFIEPSSGDHYPKEVDFPKYEIQGDSLIYTWYESSGGMEYSIIKHTLIWNGKATTHQQTNINEANNTDTTSSNHENLSNNIWANPYCSENWANEDQSTAGWEDWATADWYHYGS